MFACAAEIVRFVSGVKAAGEALVDSPAIGQTGSVATAEHVPTAVEPANGEPAGPW